MNGSSTLRFDFFAPPRIAFGWGRRSEVGRLAATLGRRAFLVSGSATLERLGTFAEIESCLQQAGLTTALLTKISREPEVDDVDATVARLRDLAAGPGDVVIAVGGGSAIDLAKAAAALATNSRGSTVADYLEGVGKGFTIEAPPLPVLAIPTTAGTGSEATKNAVISSSSPPFKKSLRSDLMVPRVVLIDPELTVSLPPSVTAHTGMAALTQLIESHLSRRAQPIPQALARSGLELALPSIVAAAEDGTNRAERERMSYAAFLSGMALANSGLGLAHGVAAALGIHCGVPHGLACAVMLPAALRINRQARLAEIAGLWSLVDDSAEISDEEAAERFIAHIEAIAGRIGIPQRLSALGVSQEQIPALVAGSHGNSLDGNPRAVSDEELRTLLEEML
jgi:alcohol dehydrogenase class IV